MSPISSLIEIKSRFLNGLKAIVDRKVFSERKARIPLTETLHSFSTIHDNKKIQFKVINISETGVAVHVSSELHILPLKFFGEITIEKKSLRLEFTKVRENQKLIAFTFSTPLLMKNLLIEQIPFEILGSRLVFIRPQGKELDPTDKFWFFSPDVGEMFFNLENKKIQKLNLTYSENYFEYKDGGQLHYGKINETTENSFHSNALQTISLTTPQAEQLQKARKVILGIQTLGGDLREDLLKIFS